jgi:hypothetical protein
VRSPKYKADREQVFRLGFRRQRGEMLFADKSLKSRRRVGDDPGATFILDPGAFLVTKRRTPLTPIAKRSSSILRPLCTMDQQKHPLESTGYRGSVPSAASSWRIGGFPTDYAQRVKLTEPTSAAI